MYMFPMYMFPMYMFPMYIFPMYAALTAALAALTAHRRAGRPHGVYCTRYIYPVWFSLYIIETVSIINSYRELEAYRK